MRLSDVGNKYVPCSSWKGGAVFSKKLPDPFDDDNTHLAFNVVRVNGKFLAGLEIEIDDFEIRGIVNKEPLDGSILKPARLVETDSLHGWPPFSLLHLLEINLLIKLFQAGKVPFFIFGEFSVHPCHGSSSAVLCRVFVEIYGSLFFMNRVDHHLLDSGILAQGFFLE